MERTQVILVNDQDQQIGIAQKIEAHQQALLHRAFSVFIFREHNEVTELLMQQRHADKYHCGGLWTNTCCSHPQPGEDTISAGQARLQEELGFSVPLVSAGQFIYQATFDNGLTEHEYDHVLVGQYNGPINQYNRHEIAQVRWMSLSDIETWLKQHPEALTPWFATALELAQLSYRHSTDLPTTKP